MHQVLAVFVAKPESGGTRERGSHCGGHAFKLANGGSLLYEVLGVVGCLQSRLDRINRKQHKVNAGTGYSS